MRTRPRFHATRLAAAYRTGRSRSLVALALAGPLAAGLGFPAGAVAMPLRIDVEGTLDFFESPQNPGISRDELGIDDGSRFAIRMRLDPIDLDPNDQSGGFEVKDVQISFEGAVFSIVPRPHMAAGVAVEPSGELRGSVFGWGTGTLNGLDLTLLPVTALPELFAFNLPDFGDPDRLATALGMNEFESGVLVFADGASPPGPAHGRGSQ